MTLLEFIGFICAVAIFSVTCMVLLFLLTFPLSWIASPIVEFLK